MTDIATADRRKGKRGPKPTSDRHSVTVRVSSEVLAKINSFAWGEANADIEKALRKHWKMPVKTLAMLAAVLLASTAHAQTYGPYPTQTYIECIPAHPSGVAVALLHGNWANGADTQANAMQVCQRLARASIYVMNINYRTAYQMPWPAQLQDAQLAIRTLRAKGYKSVGVAGTSAGGAISLMAGVTAKSDKTLATDPKREWDIWWKQNPRPDFVVDISGPTDFVMEIADGLPDGMPTLMNRLEHMSIDQAIYDISAVNFVTCTMPPTIIFQGLHDPHTHKDQAQELAGKLAVNSVPFEYVPYNGGHVLDGLTVAQQNGYIAEAARFALAAGLAPKNGSCGL